MEIIIPPRRAIRGHPARRNVEEQKLPNAPEVQPQGEVTNVEFREAVRMLSQVVANKVGQQGGARQGEADTSWICEFLRMNPPSFTGSRTTEDPQNFTEELKKVFDVMHVVDTERIELAAYQMKNDARTWFDQWKWGRDEDAPPESWACFEEAFLGCFLPRELKEAKKQKEHVPSYASAPTPKNKGEYYGQNSRAKPAYSQGSVVQGVSKPSVCAKCGRNHSGVCREGSTGCFMCGQTGHFMRECPKSKQGKVRLSSVELSQTQFS
ncbi:uncharacterized protein LOC125808560 [Solanum verrucosum]|uniref:uncharacterized protein LOC125808560 n=1 Tax=Solanum verrucosum TaxID=315347 RepID=UPI0020D0D9FA|nr:uncharacterized protein LOC125808560 [Solanum verrucosum]